MKIDTWYGWNLSSWTTRNFARRYYKHLHVKRKNRMRNTPKMRHPRIKLAWGGLWKPLSQIQKPYRQKWRRDGRVYL